MLRAGLSLGVSYSSRIADRLERRLATDFDRADTESRLQTGPHRLPRRGSISPPRVARDELPWVHTTQSPPNPESGCIPASSIQVIYSMLRRPPAALWFRGGGPNWAKMIPKIGVLMVWFARLGTLLTTGTPRGSFPRGINLPRAACGVRCIPPLSNLRMSKNSPNAPDFRGKRRRHSHRAYS